MERTGIIPVLFLRVDTVSQQGYNSLVKKNKQETKMLGIKEYSLFLISGIILNITPGTDIIYVLSRASVGGRKVGIVSAFGICTGILIHTVLVALGLSALLASSKIAFNIMKYLGALYLVYMGIKAIISKETMFESGNREPQKLSAVFRQGVLTNALNPKVLLFFLALLPQFVVPDNPYGPVPFLILGLTFFSTSIIWCLLLAYLASFVSEFLNRNEKVSKFANKFAGVVYILLGLNILR